MASTTYEVQVLQAGKWRIHAQFPASGREEAIEEAKTLESMPGITGIKVVRDSYDDRTGLHNEHIVHKHTPKPQTFDTGMGGGSKYDHYLQRASAARAMDIADPFQGGGASARKSSSFTTVIIKFLLVLLFSIGVAALATMILNSTVPHQTIAGIKFYGDMRVKIMIGTSLVFFVVTLVSMFRIFMRKDELDAPNLELLERQRRDREKARKKAEADKRRREKEKEKEKKKRTKEEEEELKRKAEEELKRQAEEDEAKKKAEEEAKKQAEEPAEEEQPKEEEEEFSRLSPMAEQQKTFLMGFFGESLRRLPAERKKMDNYNRFGVNLFLAGAVEALGGERNLDAESVTIILSDALQMMGLKPEHAEAFAKRYEDYLLQDARYMEMFQAGRRSLSDYLGGDKETTSNLDKSLHEWNKPKQPEDPEREVVVMFTDIVGSTALTHEKGNLAAQEVVRAHNRIVRDALAKAGGKEIKHTGDGIMASFENVTKSLLATQQMQTMIGMHNAQTPDVPLKVKIGINAGRVVMEEQDLYGVTVQMAARIVDKASADQIFVSDTVYGLAKGGDWRFVTRGPYYLKGIDGPAYLKEFVWDDKADIEAVKADAEAKRPQLEQAYTAASGQPLPGQQVAQQTEAPEQATEGSAQPAAQTAQAQDQTAQAQPLAQPVTHPAQQQPAAQPAPQQTAAQPQAQPGQAQPQAQPAAQPQRPPQTPNGGQA